MTRRELVGLTLDQLISAFAEEPNNFSIEITDVTSRGYSNALHSSIMWRDKTNGRTIVMLYNKKAKELQCTIYAHDIQNINNMSSLTPDAAMCSDVKWFKIFDSNYKKFDILRKLIVHKDIHNKNHEFLDKLRHIFPSMMDDVIFGKKQ